MAKRGLICVSALAENAEALVATLEPVQHLADVIEIRLDGMKNPTLDRNLLGLSCPLLVTNRPRWEGGLFSGSEEERVAILCQAMQAGADYVDIELRAASALREQVLETAGRTQTRTIISCHDFTGTPATDALQEILEQMAESGADVGKIVTTATNEEEALRVLALQLDAKRRSFPLSSFAMGAAGEISRFATLYLGGFMSYAAISEQQATAPGQLTVAHLHSLVSLFERIP